MMNVTAFDPVVQVRVVVESGSPAAYVVDRETGERTLLYAGAWITFEFRIGTRGVEAVGWVAINNDRRETTFTPTTHDLDLDSGIMTAARQRACWVLGEAWDAIRPTTVPQHDPTCNLATNPCQAHIDAAGAATEPQR